MREVDLVRATFETECHRHAFVGLHHGTVEIIDKVLYELSTHDRESMRSETPQPERLPSPRDGGHIRAVTRVTVL